MLAYFIATHICEKHDALLFYLLTINNKELFISLLIEKMAKTVASVR